MTRGYLPWTLKRIGVDTIVTLVLLTLVLVVWSYVFTAAFRYRKLDETLVRITPPPSSPVGVYRSQARAVPHMGALFALSAVTEVLQLDLKRQSPGI